jgi:hypothetical protein
MDEILKDLLKVEQDAQALLINVPPIARIAAPALYTDAQNIRASITALRIKAQSIQNAGVL